MTVPRSLRAAAVLLALGLTSATAPALAAGPSAHASPAVAANHLQQLTINITTTGSTVWGTVTVRYTYRGHTVQRSTSQALATFAIPRGVTVHLAQRPLNAITWPFEEWTITRGAQTSDRSAAATSFKMTGNYQVTAVYFFN
ncbi:MAG: hypothetical protein JOZ41_20605 [Chloroflexi bacterium]|nr:hypothetical protein [Chloroflexota bacterium]